uniref:CCDC92 domain-containing protein n=1 Tax=Panagrellus redivivus TaxID=6233 RepID=A0A7E4VYD1_PANRE
MMMVDVCPQVEPSSERHVQEAVAERDRIWRLHEKAQISFIQGQNAQMLSHLHSEIDRLMNINRELTRKLNVGTKLDEEILESKLERAGAKISHLSDELDKQKRINSALENTLEKTEERIRQLSAELHDRTQTVTQLSTQLRSIKLKEAMAQAQQRRRASCTSPKSPHSPAEIQEYSPFRLFGFNRNTAVIPNSSPIPSTSSLRTVSMRQPMWQDPVHKENNIEKARTLSNSFITARPRHLATLRRAGSTSGDSL